MLNPAPADRSRLPAGMGEALWRGARGRCPRCGAKGLFHAFLKPVARCHACFLDLTPQRADDFPPYISIFLTGHLITPVVVAMMYDDTLALWQVFSVILPLAAAMLVGFLQPAKGATIALQWWLGMHGFVRERRNPPPEN